VLRGGTRLGPGLFRFGTGALRPLVGGGGSGGVNGSERESVISINRLNVTNDCRDQRVVLAGRAGRRANVARKTERRAIANENSRLGKQRVAGLFRRGALDEEEMRLRWGNGDRAIRAHAGDPTHFAAQGSRCASDVRARVVAHRRCPGRLRGG
jgi:hypothetical protein